MAAHGPAVCHLGGPGARFGHWLAAAAAPGRVATARFFLLFLLILLPLLAGSVRVDLALQSEDVRTQAQHWLEANLPAGTPLAVDYFPPNLDPAVWPVTRQFHIYDQDVAWYQARGIRYVILSQAISDPAKLGAADLAAYNDLVNQSCLVYTFTGSFLSVTKMQMWLYQLPPCP